jgi:hypothetical protein
MEKDQPEEVVQQVCGLLPSDMVVPAVVVVVKGGLADPHSE